MPARVKANTASATPDTDEECEWDTTPLTFRHWYTLLPEYLEDCDPDYVTMWERGYCMDKAVCITPTVYHATATRDRLVNRKSFEDPIDSGILLECPLPRGVRDLSTGDKERVKSGPEFFYRKDRSLCRDILKTISVRKVRKLWKKKADGSGLKLLEALRDYAREVGPNANNAIGAKLQRAVERGPEARTVAAWNLWQDYYDTWNAAQSEDAVVPPTLVASKYEAAARKLGEPLASQFTQEIRFTGARGDPDKVAAAINSLLAEYEAEQIEKSESGGAAMQAGSDPRLTRLNPTGAGRDAPGGGGANDAPPGDCKYCGERHWHSECTVRKKMVEERKKLRSAKKSAKKEAKAAKLAAAKATEEASAAANAKSAPGGAAPGAAAVATHTQEDHTAAGDNAGRAGELLVSSSFFEDGAQTVSLSSGGGLAVLRGTPAGGLVAEPVSSSDDSSSDESPGSLSSVSQPLGSEPDTDNPSDELPTLGYTESDSGEDGVAIHSNFTNWARPKPLPAAAPRSGRAVETRGAAPATNVYSGVFNSNPAEQEAPAVKRTRKAAYKNKTKATCANEPTPSSGMRWLLGLNAVLLMAVLAVLCARPFHDPGIANRHLWTPLDWLPDCCNFVSAWHQCSVSGVLLAGAARRLWSRRKRGPGVAHARGYTPPGTHSCKTNRTSRNSLPYSVRSARRLQAKCRHNGQRPAIDGRCPREVPRSCAPPRHTDGFRDFKRASGPCMLDLPPSKNIRGRLIRMVRRTHQLDIASCAFTSAMKKSLATPHDALGAGDGRRPHFCAAALMLLSLASITREIILAWVSRIALGISVACFLCRSWSRRRWQHLRPRHARESFKDFFTTRGRHVGRTLSLRSALQAWTGRSAPWKCRTPQAALMAFAALHGTAHAASLNSGRSLSLVVDSGCVWHVVKDASLLTNTRPCNDTMYGADGLKQECSCIGELPVLAPDRNGKMRKTTVTNVRCVPGFVCPMLSVRQLWRDSKVNTLFADRQCLVVADSDGSCTELPFELAADDLYRWEVQVPDAPLSKVRGARSIGSAFIGGIHAAGSMSHLEIMSAADVGTAMHHRLHLSSGILRRLPSCTTDAPAALKHCPTLSCDACTEANATHLSHSHSSGHPSAKPARSSRPGELVCADIAGPFIDSAHGGYKYALVIVDDFTRYKWVYFMRSKGEAPEYVNTFIASFNSLLAKRFGADGAEPHVVSAIHTDNAGELISRKFTELLDKEQMNQSHSPAYTHHANGVAERAIRSIFNLVRSNMVAGGLKPGLWTYAVRHSLDVLNRTTGPATGNPGTSSFETSFELLTGEQPKIMGIMPLCCRAFAVKPREAYSKTKIDTRAWVGYNLGRSAKTVGAYDIYVQSLQRIVTTSEVYFDETLMPLRAVGDQRVGAVAPTPPPVSDETAAPGGLPQVNEKKVIASRQERMTSLRDAVNKATGRGDGHLSTKVLVLFSGPYNRPDGLGAYLAGMGLDAIMIDNDAQRGGDARHDIMHDSFFQSLLRRVAMGEFLMIIAAPPCSTFSVSRFFPSKSAKDGGPPPVRFRDHITGRPDCPANHRAELNNANELVRRMAILLHVAHGAGTEFLIENPSDRGNTSEPSLFIDERHGPIWLMPDMQTLKKACSCSMVTFSQCNFGAPSQKYTTFMMTASLLPLLSHLDRLRCTHSRGEHEARAGGEKDGEEWNSREHAAFPPALNFLLAETAAALVRQQGATDTPRQRVSQPTPSSPAHDRLAHDRGVGSGGAPPPPLLPEGATGEGIGPPRLQLEGPPAQDSPATPARTVSAPVDSPTVSSWSSPNAPSSRAVTEATSAPSVFSPGGTNMEAYDDFTVPDQPGEQEARKDKNNPAARSPQRTRRRVREESLELAGSPPLGERRLDSDASYATLAAALSAVLQEDADLPRHFAPALLVKCSKWQHRAYGGALVTALGDPSNHREAMDQDEEGWRPSEIKEIKAHRRNGSFTEIDRSELPKGRRLVRMTWAYKTKRDGTKKSRLCVQGCSQVPGVDYDQTHSATLRPTSLRILAALAAKLGLKMRRWDFTSAFLQGSLLEGETIFCSPAPGYEEYDEDGNSRLGADGLPKILRIEKPVYGMAQAGRRWQRGLFEWLAQQGFRALEGDNCVYVKTRRLHGSGKEERLIVGVYVDDLCVLYDGDGSDSLYAEFTGALTSMWEVEDEGEISDLLGVEISREGSCVVLRQTAYIRKLVKQFMSEEYRIKATYPINQGPCDESLCRHVCDALMATDAVDPVLQKKYQSLVGALLYCSTQTRPDVAFAVGYLCRAMAKPTQECYQDALRVLMYLDKHEGVGLRYCANSTPVYGMSDSDWAVKHSTSGWTFQFQQATISWASKK